MNEKIKIQKEFIYQNMKTNSPWVLVILQSVLEYVLKDINEKRKLKISLYDLTLSTLINTILIEHFELENYEIFHKLNRAANEIKHGLSVTMDLSFAIEYLNAYNSFITNFYSENKNLFLIQNRFNQLTNRDEQISPVAKKKINLRDQDYIYTVKTDLNNKRFGIYRLKYQENNKNNYSFSKYSIIYGLYTRSSLYVKDGFIKKYEEQNQKELDLNMYYKTVMTILNLIRNNYPIEDVLTINFVNVNSFEIKAAIESISYYHQMIDRLSHNKTNGIKIYFDIESPNVITFDEQEGSHVIEIDDNLWARNIDISWDEPRIKYSIDEVEHYGIIKTLFFEFFGFEDFKKGQYESICNTLNNFSNSIVILPTGGGKSAVYLFNILMSPGSSIIISPTDLLIEDQVRNFYEQYRIDNVTTINYYDKHFINKFNKKVIFISPFVFQREEIIRYIINSNSEYTISNVIIDEVHTLCNWSHDFRPDYLMLIKNLVTFLDNPKHLGFTATANHRVIDDLINQLNLNDKDVYSPIIINPENYNIEFIDYINDVELYNKFLIYLLNLSDKINKNNRVIIFTKNIEVSKTLLNKMKFSKLEEVLKVSEKSTYSYYDFIDGEKTILFATQNIGIGLNLQNIRYSIHYGLPLSKANFIQEIGRVDREDLFGKSIVFSLNTDFASFEDKRLLDYNLPNNEIIYQLTHDSTNNIYSDIKNSYKYLFNNIENRSETETKMDELLNYLDPKKYKQVIKVLNSQHEIYKRILYSLNNIGYINNWYYVYDPNDSYYLIYIEYSEEGTNLNILKANAKTYLNMMGDFPDYIDSIDSSKSTRSILRKMENWFYDEYLFFHREQYLNMIDFAEFSMNKSSDEIVESLRHYFYLDIEETRNIYIEINKLNIIEILNMSNNHIIEYSFYIEQLLLIEYNYKLDILMLMYYIVRRGYIHNNRFSRILSKLSNDDKQVFIDNLILLFSRLTDIGKYIFTLELLEYLDLDKIFEVLFNKDENDLIYLAVISSLINERMEKFNNAL